MNKTQHTGNKGATTGVMKPAERFLTAISGGTPDSLALSIWNNKLPGGEVDRQILDLEVCVIVKSSVWKMEYEGIGVEYSDEKLSGTLTRRIYRYKTKYGPLEEVRILEPGTSWIREFMYKSPDDYKALGEVIAARVYHPDHTRFLDDWDRYGDQSVARPVTIHSPFHELIYEFMGMESFSIEFAMYPERLRALEDILAEDWRKRISSVRSSPARYCIIEGNTDARVVGPQTFREHYFPFIREACRELHEKGILAGAHLDSDNRELAGLFAATDIDLVESFTPPPDCHMTLPEARRAWPGKAIQVHFPSSVHLESDRELRSYCRSLVEQLEGKRGIAIGVSEDLPGRGVNTLVPMYRYLREFENLIL